MIRVAVLYPNQPDLRFDWTYYYEKHIPLVAKLLGPMGLVRAEVDKGLAGGAPGAPAAYVCMTYLYYNDVSDLHQGMAAHGREIMGDIANYTNVQPQIQISEITVS